MMLPRLYRLRQDIPSPACDDVIASVSDELRSAHFPAVAPGDTVAIAAGSRGIADGPPILRAVADWLARKGARPFIVPAMGSHGGGTASGQEASLRRLGITEESVGCPVRSSMETLLLGATEDGVNVHLDRLAAEADRVVVVNRVKPHTRFTAPIESGLVKMCLVGLGKAAGAAAMHGAADRLGWKRVYETAFPLFASAAPPCAGIAVLENARGRVARVAGLAAGEFLVKEPELLIEARSFMARIPFSGIDLLIVDKMGKDISGTGMDTNVTGRKEGMTPVSKHLFVRDLTPAAGGNALGIGLADFTTRLLVEKIDRAVTELNARTAHRHDASRVPPAFSCDREALEASASLSAIRDATEWRIVWIRNTLELEDLWVSEGMIDEARAHPSLAIESGPLDVRFDAHGNLLRP